MGFLAWGKRLDDRVEKAAHRRFSRLAARRDMPPERKRRYFTRVSLGSAVVAVALWVFAAAGAEWLLGVAWASTVYSALFAFEAMGASRAATREAPPPTRR